MAIHFITGAIGSGKTHAANLLGNRTGLELVSLDSIVFDLHSDTHRATKSPQVRDAELARLLEKRNVLFEGWHFGQWLVPMYQRLHRVIMIDTPLPVRIERIKEHYRRRKAGSSPTPSRSAARNTSTSCWSGQNCSASTRRSPTSHPMPRSIATSCASIGRLVSRTRSD